MVTHQVGVSLFLVLQLLTLKVDRLYPRPQASPLPVPTLLLWDLGVPSHRGSGALPLDAGLSHVTRFVLIKTMHPGHPS